MQIIPSTTRTSVVLWLVLVSLFSTGCVVSKSPVTGNRRAYGYTWEQEIQIGKESDPQIIAQYGLYDDVAMAKYVEDLGQNILAFSHLRRPDTEPEYRNTAFTFRVLDSPVINAFALPGGYIYVTRGLMAHMENEAQLAVVLGHEIGHVAARHASQRAATQAFGQLGLIGAAIGGQVFLGGDAAENILNLGGTAAQLLFLSYGRDDERESDELGVEYSALAGYKAGEGSAFFTSLKRLGAQQEQSLPGFLSTHPDPGEREQTILRMAAEWAQRTEMTKVNQESLLAQVNGVVLGDNPRQGFAEDGVFYHPDLRFRFPVPSGFTMINQPSQVALVGPNQQAILLFSLAEGAASAREASDKFAAQEGLTVVERGQGQAQGLPARYILADAQTQDGQEVRLRAYFVDYDDRVYTFLGYSAKETYATYASAFTSTMQGFGRLTDGRILNIQPTRLTVVTTDRSAVFKTYLPGTLPASLSAEGMAILNQVGLEEQIPPGRRLKLIQ